MISQARTLNITKLVADIGAKTRLDARMVCK